MYLLTFFQLHILFITQLAPYSSIHNLFYELVQVHLLTLPKRLGSSVCLRHSSRQNSYYSINICGLTGRSEISLLTLSKSTILINCVNKVSLHLVTVISHYLSLFLESQLSYPSLFLFPPFPEQESIVSDVMH